ncbi:hypothetical protein GCM10027085_23720 [Spirosoma aerophilum]
MNKWISLLLTIGFAIAGIVAFRLAAPMTEPSEATTYTVLRLGGLVCMIIAAYSLRTYFKQSRS